MLSLLILALASGDILTSLIMQRSRTMAVQDMVAFAVIDDDIKLAQFHFQYCY
jgi:hypothetical protein